MPTHPPRELSERFANFVRFLDSKGGKYQRTRILFAEELQLPSPWALQQLTSRAEELGILDIERTGHPMIGEGRFPNTYRLKISYADFCERRVELYEERIAREKAKKQAAVNERKRKRRKAARDADEESKREARARWKERQKGPVPTEPTPPPLPTPPANARAPVSDAAAWSDFDDF